MDMPDDASAFLNQHLDGWSAAMGLHYLQAGRDEVRGEMHIGAQHLQAYGIVHGGVHAGLIETLASVGAALNGLEHGQSVVGLENHTSFVRAVPRRAEVSRHGAPAADARPPVAVMGSARA